MQFSSWPRHQLRAQGRRYRLPEDAESGTENIAIETPGKKSGSKQQAELLNFLSRTAAQSERKLLSPIAVPDFARVHSLSGKPDKELAQLLFRRRAPKRQAALSLVAKQAASKPETLLGMLADTLSEFAGGDHNHWQASKVATLATAILPSDEPFDKPWQISDVTTVAIFEDSSRTATAYGVESSEAEKFCDCLADLDKWLSGAGEPEDQPIEESPSARLFGLSHADVNRTRAGSLPVALPPVLPTPFDDPLFDEPLTVGVNVDMYEPLQPLTGGRKPERNPSRRSGSRHKRALYNRHVMFRPRTITLPDGARKERFDNGAQLYKDALGRVVEISAANGGSIWVRYDEQGHPKSFRRTLADGSNHSLAEKDRHGVVVRDPEGRVRAAGESMAVDPSGCLSVRRFDGQFWSLDLVRGVHIERRRVNDREGHTHVLTALFAFDGFRMVTRFQPVPDGPADSLGQPGKWLAEEPSGTFRFYGRDGSMIQFDSEDDLIELKPSRLWQPGSRIVASDWRGHHQAGTAWESVQEYVTNYLLA